MDDTIVRYNKCTFQDKNFSHKLLERTKAGKKKLFYGKIAQNFFKNEKYLW
jgi:hypothetical protein